MKFSAIEYVLPSVAVGNDEVLRRVHDDSKSHLTSSELRRAERLLRFAFRAMGTEVRYTRADDERPHELCAAAGRKAIASSGLDPTDIDLLLYVGVGRGFLEPATANVFQDVLGLSRATGFDVLDACASWLRGVQIARTFIEAGVYRHVMILNAEFNANFENNELRSLEEFDHRFPTFTIGEAATATILSASEADDECAMTFRTYGDQRGKCIIPLANWSDYLAAPGDELEPHRFTSWGRDIMQFGLAKLVEQYQEDSRFHNETPDIVFFHAASDGMARDGMRQCGLDESLGFYTHARYANTVSATVPLAMATARDEGRLRPGMRAVTAVASAGISIGLARFVYLE